MSKAIKLDDQVYERLDKFRGKGETFSQAVSRALEVVEIIHQGYKILGPSHWINERPERSEKAEAASYR